VTFWKGSFTLVIYSEGPALNCRFCSVSTWQWSKERIHLSLPDIVTYISFIYETRQTLCILMYNFGQKEWMYCEKNSVEIPTLHSLCRNISVKLESKSCSSIVWTSFQRWKRSCPKWWAGFRGTSIKIKCSSREIQFQLTWLTTPPHRVWTLLYR